MLEDSMSAFAQWKQNYMTMKCVSNLYTLWSIWFIRGQYIGLATIWFLHLNEAASRMSHLCRQNIIAKQSVDRRTLTIGGSVEFIGLI